MWVKTVCIGQEYFKPYAGCHRGVEVNVRDNNIVQSKFELKHQYCSFTMMALTLNCS